MLTEQEKKWLEEREERFAIHGIYSNPQIIPSYWQTFALTPDYKDAAEFEARVVVEVTRLYKSLANISILPNQMGVIKQARINVEKKMETEQC